MLEAISGFLGSGLGKLVTSAGSAVLGGLLDSSKASDRQDDAQQFSAQQYATRYQTTVKDLQAAGLSPMLAYGQGPGSAPSSSAASVGSNFSNVGSVINQARLNNAQIANIEADTENKAAQGRLIDAQAAAANASASQSNASVSQLNAQANKLIEETKNIPIEGRRLEFLIENLRSSSSLMGQQQLTESQRLHQVQALVRKINAESDLLDLDKQAADRLENLGRTSKELAPIVQVILSVLRSSRR